MEGKERSKKLSSFDVTAIVVGSAIGADIYVVTAVSAKMVGPASLLAWAFAGVLALFIALSFAYCVTMCPRVGGPYAYLKETSHGFVGFMVGWDFLVAELFSLAAFPIAFAQYFTALFQGIPNGADVVIKVLFVAFVVVTNVVGVKIAGRTNDVLTIAKLAPLGLIIVGGFVLIAVQPGTTASHFSPFLLGDPTMFGQAVVLAFWAYAGFELSTFPAADVEEPSKTIPRALLIGMLIVVAFYMLVNFVVVASIAHNDLPSGNSPLIGVAASIFSPLPLLASAAVIIVGVGALLSISGADESGTIGTSRLAYAMSADGLLPEVFSRTSQRYKTPYLGIMVIGAVVLVMSLLGNLIALINASVFLLAIGYFATCYAAFMLQSKHEEAASKLRARRLVPAAGLISSVGVMFMVDPSQIPLSLVLLALGLPVYYFFSPGKEIKEVKEPFLSREELLKRAKVQGNVFVAYALNKFRAFYKRLRHRSA